MISVPVDSETVSMLNGSENPVPLAQFTPMEPVTGTLSAMSLPGANCRIICELSPNLSDGRLTGVSIDSHEVLGIATVIGPLSPVPLLEILNSNCLFWPLVMVV